jgi:cobalt-zinc-cadmium resistance protein CzcA
MPLARAVIGGLLVSTFLTLFLIPTLYIIFERRFPHRGSADA